MTDKPKTYYMHTLNGMPAGFFDGKSVCFSSDVVLCASLRQIRKEQRVSMRNDDSPSDFRYGYQRVRLPNDR